MIIGKNLLSCVCLNKYLYANSESSSQPTAKYRMTSQHKVEFSNFNKMRNAFQVTRIRLMKKQYFQKNSSHIPQNPLHTLSSLLSLSHFSTKCRLQAPRKSNFTLDRMCLHNKTLPLVIDGLKNS